MMVLVMFASSNLLTAHARLGEKSNVPAPGNRCQKNLAKDYGGSQTPGKTIGTKVVKKG
jgi:hypothetical protein